MARVTLITGGVRSGKSSHAIALAMERPGTQRGFIATAEALDEEMSARIARHRASRPAAFETIEEPLHPGAAVKQIGGRVDVVLVDCLTVWVANLMGRGDEDGAIIAEADTLIEALEQAECEAIVVTDEVGWGVVPDNAVARRFRDLLGAVNQKVAQAADTVLLMVAGYPMRLK